MSELNSLLKDEIVKILAENSSDMDAFDVSEDAVPYVILVVGVNGVGKTTTIGKLAAQFKEGGLNVLIGAADTFRAAAVDQILMWGDKVGVDVVSHGMNTDPASVAYDTVKKAVEEKYDVVIIDTAGRLHTKLNLMNELSKIKELFRSLKKMLHMRYAILMEVLTKCFRTSRIYKSYKCEFNSNHKIRWNRERRSSHWHNRSVQDTN